VRSNTISGWVLPSPAWATTAIVTSRACAMASMPRTSAPSCGIGHADVLQQQRALFSTAGIAIRRAT
jgi:hypothetical protein